MLTEPEQTPDPAGASYYRMSTTGALPIAWLPPEALVDMKFSEASDVWAFGVTMVECFTRGAPPYNRWTPLDIMYRVKEGYVITKPEACPASWYSTLIQPCFAFAADGRPLFKELVEAPSPWTMMGSIFTDS